MTIIGTKWVFKNKLDENGIVSRNKARLVAQGYNQQEGIDYDETYALVVRLYANKQRSIAMFSAEAKDIAAAGCFFGHNIPMDKESHIDYDIIYEKIKNHTLKWDIEFHFIPTQYQLAAIFIKLLDKPSFKRLIDEIGMLNIDSKPEASVLTEEN
ncbi:retrovirus-related pol polyprotein from transposon TNT 1-94 [Tanacetum coccineum]